MTELSIGVIDDDQDVRHAIRRLLRAAGFAAETFTSAEDFLESKLPSPDCLVLDVQLSRLSGFELQERLAASGRAIPIVFITAHDDPATRERARQAGDTEYLRKPFEDLALIGAIHRAISRASGPAA